MSKNKNKVAIVVACILFALILVVIAVLLITPREQHSKEKNLSVQERLTSGFWYARDPETNNRYQATEYTFYDDGTYRMNDGLVSPADGYYDKNYVYGAYTVEDNTVTLTDYENNHLFITNYSDTELSRILTYSEEHDTFIWSEEVEHNNMQKAIHSQTPLTYNEVIELIDSHSFYLNEKDVPVVTELAPSTNSEDLIIPAVNFFNYGHCCDVKTITDEKTLTQISPLIPAEYTGSNFEVQEVLCKTCKSKENVMAHIENCIVTEKPADLPEDNYYFDSEVIGHKINKNQIITLKSKIYIVTTNANKEKRYNKYDSFSGNFDNPLNNAPNIFPNQLTMHSYNTAFVAQAYLLKTNNTYKIIRIYDYLPGE